VHQAAYKLADKMTDIYEGNNGFYKAKKKYDLCTGLGVPNVGFTAAWLEENGFKYDPTAASKTSKS
jgi:hypothetical protein